MTSSTRTPARTPVRSAAAALAAAGVLAGAALLTSAPQAAAADGPSAGPAALAAAHEAATDATTLDTLSRFFAREGAVRAEAAAPRITGAAVPVRTLSARFVAGEPGAPVASLEYLASTAVSSDGQKASLWTLPEPGADGDWQVVNIATGDDEARYAAAGARKLPGGIVFHEPQINAWYVQKGNRVLPLDQDAVRAVGKKGTTLSAYRSRVHAAYADKLPGSAYARKGEAGGYGPAAPKPAERERSGRAIADTASTADTALTAGSTAAAGGALAVLALCGATALRLRGRRRTG
ncbi:MULTISPECIES: hypothetical protein [unclassified Streptomyces]|uniref:hypothetical protein n=1 Tax=unclassified Streptomyces TaxID=2593676 RepID=UPI000DAC82D4|nr:MULTISPECIES: hypothetical protein [unclassified Streptomyces]PZT74479.1 hypothetical protein DNK55_20465 [Streptomyces sp. AC1-42T]PZT82534.1 hypothetical protein DNK56_10980 [Streptomyces sp. AC1-42W]